MAEPAVGLEPGIERSDEFAEGDRTIGVGTHERRVVGQAGPPTA